jgi:hypothetical protein
MQKTKTSGTKGLIATGIVLGALALFSGKASAGVIPKSNASTFLDNVPGLSLAPSRLTLSKATKGNGYAALLNMKTGKNSGVHAARIMTPVGPLHEVGVGVSSGRSDVGVAVDELKGEHVVIGGVTFRASNAVTANAVVKSGKDGKLEWVLNSDVALGQNAGVSVRQDNQGSSVGLDANVAGFMPSASITVTEKGKQVDANIWSPSFGPGGKLQATTSVSDISGEKIVKIGLRVKL